MSGAKGTPPWRPGVLRDGHSLEEIHFGDQRLLIESDDRLVLPVGVPTAEAAEVRPAVKDWLDLLSARYRATLTSWDGDLDHLRPLVEDRSRPSGLRTDRRPGTA